MKVKYHGVEATLIRETDMAVCMSFSHPEYGKMVEIWVPKSVILEDSLEDIDEHGDGDTVEVFIKAWWLRKNFG